MKFKELLKYILYTQKYRIILYDGNMHVVSKSCIIKNDNLYNRVNKDNEAYLECKVTAIYSELDYIVIAVIGE